MLRYFYLLVFVTVALQGQAQLYYPPNGSTTWDTMTPAEAGFDETRLDSLYSYLEQTNGKAFIVLKDGKLVIERYFGSTTSTTLLPWNSAGKSLTAFAVGIAQQEGFLDIDNRSNLYMGNGWTNETLTQENQITVLNQLTMTSGLDDGVPDNFCTLPSCLLYRTDPGLRWAYHNAPYTLLDSVIEKATSQTLNSYIAAKVRNPIGMNGAYFRIDYNNIYISNARSLARFGLLSLSKGIWNGTPILNDTAYFRAMVNTSQSINKSYGYLWWLNGKESYRLPSLQLQFSGSFAPNAPADLFAAIGKDGQICAVVPSQNLVVVRMGSNPGDGSLAPVGYIDSMWKRINYALIVTADDEPQSTAPERYRLYPNPATETVNLVATDNNSSPARGFITAQLVNTAGQIVRTYSTPGLLDLQGLPTGLYTLQVLDDRGVWQGKLVKVE